MSGWKSWEIGEVVEADDFQTYVQNQVVQTYADSAARSTALGTAVAEGMVSFTADDDNLAVYANGNWNTVSQAISPNYIINGAFDIWQRGTSFTGFTASTFVADRFYINPSGATVTATQQAFTPADITAIGYGEGQYYLRTELTVADNNCAVRQKIEDVRTLAGQTVTISFWAKDDNASPLAVAMFQNFGSGGSSAVTTNFTAQTLTTSWVRYSVTGTLPSISGKTIGAGSNIELYLGLPNNETNTLDIWGVQLEAGSVATPFRRNANSIQGELAACQRYYYKMESVGGLHIDVGYAGSTTAARYALKTPVQMRTTPTLTATNLRIGFGSFSVNTPSAIGIQGYLGNSAEIRATASTTALTAGEAVLLNTDAVLGGSLELSAEL